MNLTVDTSSPNSPSRQLVDQLLDHIATGRLSAGQRLASIRAGAAEALVNPNTVGKAYRELELLGVVEARNGSGVFVTDNGPVIARLRRQGETLAALESALAEALRAGHDPDSLHDRLAARLQTESEPLPCSGDPS